MSTIPQSSASKAISQDSPAPSTQDDLTGLAIELGLNRSSVTGRGRDHQVQRSGLEREAGFRDAHYPDAYAGMGLGELVEPAGERARAQWDGSRLPDDDVRELVLGSIVE